MERRLPLEIEDLPVDQISEVLRRLERRDWSLWSAAAIVMLMLTIAVASFTLPMLLEERTGTGFFRFDLDRTVRGLVGLVLLFNIYVIYQQTLIKRLRRKLAEQIVIKAGVQARAEQFHRLAMFDSVTGLYNSRFADRWLAAEVNRCRRYSYPLTVLMLAINGFDLINDLSGQSAGDKILKDFAERLTQVIRISDVGVSMGDGKFLVLLPECRAEQVEGLLGRLPPQEIDWGGDRMLLTYSAGWAEYQHNELPRELLERAERALSAHATEKYMNQAKPAV